MPLRSVVLMRGRYKRRLRGRLIWVLCTRSSERGRRGEGKRCGAGLEWGSGKRNTKEKENGGLRKLRAPEDLSKEKKNFKRRSSINQKFAGAVKKIRKEGEKVNKRSGRWELLSCLAGRKTKGGKGMAPKALTALDIEAGKTGLGS